MPKAKMDPLARAIAGKERSIANSNRLKATIRRVAEERCEKIQKNIDKQKVLLDALKRGALKP